MYALRWLRRWCALSTQELERERALFTTHVDAVRETRAVLDRREKPLWSGEIEGLLHVLEDRADALAPVADFAATMDQLDPTLWSTLLLRAWSLLAAGDTDRALEATSELARRFPRLAEAHALRARALDIAGRRDEAIAAWSDAIAADPEFAEAYLARSRLTAHTDPDAATRDRARAFDLSPALRKIVEP
jgi:tetratricopeptide (TPR) repeat protein